MKRRVITVGTVCALVALCLAGASYAYLMDVDEKRTVFTVGNVSGTLTTDYDDLEALDVAPYDTIDASPSITLNEGSEEAYAFVEVQVPVNHDVTIYDAAGMLDTSGELMSPGRAEDGWMVLNKAKSKKEDEDTKVYVYGYKKALTEDNPDTGEAFPYIYVSNFVESDALEDAEIVISGALIQTKGLGYEEKATLQQGELEEIYSYINTQM